MQVSVETLSGLEHKVTVSVPSEKVEEEVSLRLRNLSRKAKVPGFRPGKAPMNVIKNRFADGVREEVAREMIQSTLFEALQTNELLPAGTPQVEPEQIEPGKDFTYSAVFEIFPKVEINELNQDKIELTYAEVKDQDVEDMINKLREQNKDWHEVSRAVAMGDKIVFDFEGFIGDEPFEGGSAQSHELVIGSGAMIPGFEEGLTGAMPGVSFDLNVTFPKDYNHAGLAGKEARFAILIHTVMEGKLPELNDDFALKFNIREGGVDALRKDITDNMTRELERKVSSMNRERIFDKLMELNTFQLPMALIDKEIEHLKHDMYHRMFGNEHSEHETIPDFPRALFEAQAARRVQLGLLFSEYVRKHELVADSERVDAMIEKFASAYESPDELRQWYKGNKERLAEIQALVMEDMVAEKISEKADISKKEKSYDDVMNPKKDKPTKAEKDNKGNKDNEDKGE